MSLLLIDAIGPFFRDAPPRSLNWSKILFEHLRLDGPGSAEQWSGIYQDLETFCTRAAAMGYNAVSLDDVTHLADHPWYTLETRQRIAQWRKMFRPCFDIVRQHGLQLYLTMDVFSSTPAVRATLQQTRRSVESHLIELLDTFFHDFPEAAGIIVRIGESDARDVKAEFTSELCLKNALQVNRFLKALLPVFENHGRKLIFRTWTVGAYQVGDLMWSRDTFLRALKGIDTHPHLIVSMKYGESDFFRYLPLNANFFQTKVAKIIELQTRREYEGCGEYPSFIGWDYARYAQELQQAENMVGINVWCQTGGWVPFRRLALLEDAAIWTDLNTFVTLRVFRDRQSVEEAVRDFAEDRGLAQWEQILELLRLSDEVIRELLYVEEFAQRSLYFRRVRVPPLLQVYWNNIFISHSVRKVLRYFVTDPEHCLRSGQAALQKLVRMESLAESTGLPAADITYMRDTFTLLALARQYYFLPFSEEIKAELKTAKRAYKAKYPKSGTRHRYRIKVDYQPFWLKTRYLAMGFKLLMRPNAGYRWIDRILTLHLLSLVFRVISRRRPHWIPSFAKESAMGVETIFR